MQLTRAYVKKLFPARDRQSHKGDFGRVLVVGGSKTYSGAPALAAMAALRSGADLAYVFAPRRAADIAAGFSPNLIAYPNRGDFLNSWHLRDAFDFLKKSDAVVLGNGLGDRRETSMFMEKFLEANDKPVVLDADGIRAVVSKKGLAKQNTVLTPHGREFFMLTGKQPADSLKELQIMVQAYAKELGCTILLKGPVDVISDGIQVVINRTGNPFMTVGGTGDVLAGVCGALLAREVEPFQAACAAAWISGSAGDLAARELGESLTATDVLGKIHKVLA